MQVENKNRIWIASWCIHIRKLNRCVCGSMAFFFFYLKTCFEELGSPDDFVLEALYRHCSVKIKHHCNCLILTLPRQHSVQILNTAHYLESWLPGMWKWYRTHNKSRHLDPPQILSWCRQFLPGSNAHEVQPFLSGYNEVLGCDSAIVMGLWPITSR